MAFLKNMWKNNSKHKKLLEELALQNNKDTDVEPSDVTETDSEVTFKLKYLGCTVIEKRSSKENISTEAVKNILKKTSRATRKKLQRVNLTVSLKGITVSDLQTGNELFKVSIYRISNCSTDATQKQVFSFVSTDQNETMECHAFMCSKRKMAEAVTLTVAEAFGTAFAEWQSQPQNSKNLQAISDLENDKINKNKSDFVDDKKDNINVSGNVETPCVIEEKLIDLDSEIRSENNGFPLNSSSFDASFTAAARWVCFEDDFTTDITNESARLQHQTSSNLILA